MTNDVRLAVSGAGLIGKRHISTIEKTKGVDVAAIIDPSEEARAFAQSKGIPHFATLIEALAEAKPDGVIIATPTTLHVDQGLCCIKHGIPTLVEKPLAVSAAEGERLVNQAEEAGVPILVGHHRRYNPLIEKAHSLIKSGAIGEVRSVQATAWFYKPDDYFEVAPWRTQKGAGPISVNLVHDIDLIRHLCGEITAVQAMAKPAQRGFENEDLAGAVFQFKENGVGTITVSDAIVAPWSWEHTSGENDAYPQTDASCYLIGGSHGSLSLPDLQLWQNDGERSWLNPMRTSKAEVIPADPLENQISHFVAVIRGHEAPRVSGREGLRSLKVVEAIQNSASNQQRIEISEPSA